MKFLRFSPYRWQPRVEAEAEGFSVGASKPEGQPAEYTISLRGEEGVYTHALRMTRLEAAQLLVRLKACLDRTGDWA